MWKQLSEEFSTATKKAALNLVHLGGPAIPGRTGLLWGNGLIVSLAREARDGESVPVVVPGGKEKTAKVKAWDSRTGLVLLEVSEVSSQPWLIAPVPGTGSFVLTVAYASPQGPEARLDMVRFIGQKTDWAHGVQLESFFQTDANPWPGFTGAAVVDNEGSLVGFVVDNKPGNSGLVVSAQDLNRLVEVLLKEGSPQKAWLGVSTRPAGGQGLVLLNVEAHSPAAKADWKPGDLLISLDGTPLKSPSDLEGVLSRLKPQKEVTAKILRDGQVLERPLVPGGR
jgi:S1-C subfamily serine protease